MCDPIMERHLSGVLSDSPLTIHESIIFITVFLEKVSDLPLCLSEHGLLCLIVALSKFWSIWLLSAPILHFQRVIHMLFHKHSKLEWSFGYQDSSSVLATIVRFLPARLAR